MKSFGRRNRLEISEDNMSLQDKLDAFKADFEGNKAPPQVVAVMHKATADLIASGQAERALKVGVRAPEFALPDAHGQIVRSADLLQKGPLVVTFYRGVWCPYCNMDLQAIEEAANGILPSALLWLQSRRRLRRTFASRSARTR